MVWKDKILTPCSELLTFSPFAIKGNHLDTENQLKLKIGKGGQFNKSFNLMSYLGKVYLCYICNLVITMCLESELKSFLVQYKFQ